MRYWPLIWKRLPAAAMALFPFMIFKDPQQKNNPLLINHEKIHFQQQLELLIIPFYVLYLLNYLINLIRFKNRSKAYFNICFEKEAYANDRNINYLQNRGLYSWIKFL
ncbi:hypothetical protein [Pedobacter hartonius]|uniref:DUF4157 domain-containing protein n=1 Tax=Pedobacter hartonius TaxID=425514 RepID=A0A1H4F6U0_9SPHI|nr:hypothetical protein [Pedobacter hartonius]SEA93075.1 hypothetical protein SAMN05443550_10745 [Pedobacter hartonius]